MIETIFIDIGGVLLTIHPERTLAILRSSTGFSDDVLREVLDGEIHDAYEKGELSSDEFFSRFRDSLPRPDGLLREDFFRAWLALLGEPTKTIDLAFQLNETYPIWLVSNTNPYHIEHGPIVDYFARFTGSIYSYELGARKPETAFFEAALQHAGAEANSTLFIDDRLENVEVARRLGFHAIKHESMPQLKSEVTAILTRNLTCT